VIHLLSEFSQTEFTDGFCRECAKRSHGRGPVRPNSAVGGAGFLALSVQTQLYPEQMDAKPLGCDFDEWRVLVKRELPSPVRHFTNRRGITWLSAGDPAATVIVRVSHRSVSVYAMQCWHADRVRCGRRAMRVGGVVWADLPTKSALSLVTALIESALDLTFEDLPVGSSVPAEALRLITGRRFCAVCERVARLKPPRSARRRLSGWAVSNETT
jgi:hypothetical protein